MTTYTNSVLAEVLAERGRQDAKWGVQSHPSIDRNVAERDGHLKHATPEQRAQLARHRVTSRLGIPTAASAKIRVDQRALANDPREPLTWAHILIEELAEAVEAATDGEEGYGLREELVQVAAVAVSWIENLDRDQGRDFDTWDRLYTASEIGTAVTEVSVVTERIRRELEACRDQLRTTVTAADTALDHGSAA